MRLDSEDFSFFRLHRMNGAGVRPEVGGDMTRLDLAYALTR